MPYKRNIPRTCEYCKSSFTTTAYSIGRGGGRFCSRSCVNHDNATPAKAEARFWLRVGLSPSCWVWTGRKTTDGYGRFNVLSREVLAHRYSYELHHGPIPDGLCVCHHCDNPLCVNPAHLWVGTHRDNMRDKVAKGRQSRMLGSKHHNAKLSESDVESIRARYQRRVVTQKELSIEYGVTANEICRIVQRRTWKHIP